MRYSPVFRVGKGRLTWEIRFVFTPRMIVLGAGWDDPSEVPWQRRSCSVHLLCFCVSIQRPVDSINPQVVADWLNERRR